MVARPVPTIEATARRTAPVRRRRTVRDIAVLSVVVGLTVLLDVGLLRFSRFYQSARYLPVALWLAVIGFLTPLILSQDQFISGLTLGASKE